MLMLIMNTYRHDDNETGGHVGVKEVVAQATA